MILFAIVAGIVLYGLAAPDRATLGVTRGAAGAVRASIGSTPRIRSGPTRSTPPRSDRVGTRSTPTAPTRSRIARAIDGWIDGADGATRRRGEAAAALRRLRDRARARRAVKQAAVAWDEAHDENGRRDRAQQRARISAGAHAIALKPRDQRRPKKKPATATPRKAPAMPDITRADFTHPITTELDHLTAAQAEAGAAYVLAEQIWNAVRELNAWLLAFPERYDGASDLLKNGQMNAAVALLRERQLGGFEIEVGKVNSQLGLFMQGILNVQQKVQESDAESGRVETASAK